MDWEALVACWSRASARLLDIQEHRSEVRMVPRDDVDHIGIFVVTAGGAARISLAGKGYKTRGVHVLHGAADMELKVLPAGDDFVCYVIFYQTSGQSPEDHERVRQAYSFTPEAALPLQEKCVTMHRLWQHTNPMDKLQAQSLLLPFVWEMLRQLRSTEVKVGRPNPVTEAIRYIQAHYSESISAEELAGMYGCSTSYLSRLFKNQLGIGPIEYLIHVRIHKAKQLLLISDSRIQEIAASVGYSDVYYFSRLFKKHTGLAPFQFRADKRGMVQNNPFQQSKLSIVTPDLVPHNDNEIYYQLDEEGDRFMFRFARPTFGAMMILCTTLLLSACQGGNQTATPSSEPAATATATESATAETRIYEHMKGETEIPVKPQRIVSLFHLGELMALGVKPVGATTFIINNPLLDDVSGITDVGVPPSLEKMLELEPDLIVTTEPFAEAVEGGYEALSKIAPTIVVEQNNDPIKDIEMFGDILGKQEEAKQWNEAFAVKLEQYKEKIKPYVSADETFSILNVRPGALFVYGDTNMGGNIIYKYLGLKPTEKVNNEVIHGETWEISAEVIPDFIGERLFLAVNDGADEDLKKVESLIQNSPAGKSGKVYNIDFDEFLPSDPISVEKQLDIIVDLLTDGKE
ncbi:AraC family transcriptional regulator [Paenibacillus sp. strain BS8-2]